MSQLSPEEINEHREVDGRKVSDSYRGPHAVFTDEELLFIQRSLPVKNWEPNTDRLLQSVREKIRVALGSDPRFRTPFS